VLYERVDGISADHLKNICFQLRSEHAPVLASPHSPTISLHNRICIHDVVQSKQINCSNMVRELGNTSAAAAAA
jgi:hypothetical protein